MDIVIQCAKQKQPHAGFFRALNGKKVRFVANPASTETDTIFARPDDPSDISGKTWRERLSEYNAQGSQGNPFGLLKAYRLYKDKAYLALVQKFGEQHVFILSAAWGLIRADYLTPSYDLTFSQRAKDEHPETFCSPINAYNYFQQVPDGTQPLILLSGKDYRAPFEGLTSKLQRERIIFVRTPREGPLTHVTTKNGIRHEFYRTSTLTNWHYQCALDIANGKIDLEKFQ